MPDTSSDPCGPVWYRHPEQPPEVMLHENALHILSVGHKPHPQAEALAERLLQQSAFLMPDTSA